MKGWLSIFMIDTQKSDKTDFFRVFLLVEASYENKALFLFEVVCCTQKNPRLSGSFIVLKYTQIKELQRQTLVCTIDLM